MTTSKDRPISPTPEGINEDRAARRAAQKDPAARRAFGLLHGALAIEHPAITKLRIDSPERKIAIEAISLYPYVTRTKSKGRCDVAIKTAIETIPELREYADDESAIGRAETAVKKAFGATNLKAKAKNEALGNS